MKLLIAHAVLVGEAAIALCLRIGFFRGVVAVLLLFFAFCQRSIAEEADGLRLECESGKGEACFSLGSKAEAAGDRAGAISFFKRACEYHDWVGCNNAGWLELAGYLTEPPSEPSLDEARKLFELGCNNGLFFSCTGLGKLESSAGNIEGARQILKRTCDSSHYDTGCDVLAELEEGAFNFHEAHRLYSLACENGSESERARHCSAMHRIADELNYAMWRNLLPGIFLIFFWIGWWRYKHKKTPR